VTREVDVVAPKELFPAIGARLIDEIVIKAGRLGGDRPPKAIGVTGVELRDLIVATP
jgi:hypothetical protein